MIFTDSSCKVSGAVQWLTGDLCQETLLNQRTSQTNHRNVNIFVQAVKLFDAYLVTLNENNQQ